MLNTQKKYTITTQTVPTKMMHNFGNYKNLKLKLASLFYAVLASVFNFIKGKR